MLCRERGEIVASGISTNSHFFEVVRRLFCETSNNIGEAFGAMLATSTCRQHKLVSLDLDVHGWIDQRKETMAWAHPRKPRSFPSFDPTIKGFHGTVQAEVHFLQELAIHGL